MALFRDDAGKTEKPTPYRLADARRKGQVALSREFIMGGALVFGVLALERFGPWLLETLRAILTRGLDVNDARLRMDGGDLPAAVGEIFTTVLLIAAPFATLLLLGVAITAVFAYGQIGIQFSDEALGFKFERLNPIAGLKRVFTPAAFVRTCRPRCRQTHRARRDPSNT